MDLETIVYLIIMVVTGSTNTIFNKYINSSDKYNYYHGFFSSYLMFIGEIIPIFYLVGMMMINVKKRRENLKETIAIQRKDEKLIMKSNWIVGIGAIFDCIASACTAFALIFLPGSIAQIGRSGIIIIVAVYSYFYLKKRYTKTQYLGLFLVILGISFVFLSTILAKNAAEEGDSSSSVSTGKIVFGIILLAIGWFIQGFQIVYQEKIMEKYEVDLFRYVGIEGAYGLGFTCFILTILSHVECPKDSGLCPNSIEGHTYYIDNASTAITEMFHNPGLMALCIMFAISIALFNISGLMMTRKVSGLFRMIMDNVRSIVIWLFFIITGDEKLTKFSLIQLFGFAIFVLGTLLYNQIIVIFEKENKKSKKNSSIIASFKAS